MTLPHLRLSLSSVSLGELSLKPLNDEAGSASARWTITGHVSPQAEALPERRGVMHAVLTPRGEAWGPRVVHNTDHSGVYQGTRLGGTGQLEFTP